MKLDKVTTTADRASKRWYDDACGTALGMELVGERWSLLVVRELLLGGRRFGELRASLPGLSANILTQRLEGLEASGIVRRIKLPPPASVQVYALTDWGLDAETVVLSLGLWALRSPRHDTSLFFSPVALLLSLKMLLVRERVGDFAASIGIRIGEEEFVAEVDAAGIRVARAQVAGADAVMSGTTAAFRPLFYGGWPLAQARAEGAILVAGDFAIAERFATLFALPPKIGSEPI